MAMNIVCLDLEGVLVPEIWIAFAEASGIPELKKTTRDEPDYDKLMTWRLGILKEHGLGLKEIQETIAKIDPIPGAKEFLDELRSLTQVIIISDTFAQFATPLMKKLAAPVTVSSAAVPMAARKLAVSMIAPVSARTLAASMVALFPVHTSAARFLPLAPAKYPQASVIPLQIPMPSHNVSPDLVHTLSG